MRAESRCAQFSNIGKPATGHYWNARMVSEFIGRLPIYARQDPVPINIGVNDGSDASVSKPVC